MILNLEEQKLWERCADFHGHTCGGLAIGFQAARRAAALLGLTFSKDEEVVCVAENDACGIDAIQAVLGCSAARETCCSGCAASRLFPSSTGKRGKASGWCCARCLRCRTGSAVTGCSVRTRPASSTRSRSISSFPSLQGFSSPTLVKRAER